MDQQLLITLTEKENDKYGENNYKVAKFYYAYANLYLQELEDENLSDYSSDDSLDELIDNDPKVKQKFQDLQIEQQKKQQKLKEDQKISFCLEKSLQLCQQQWDQIYNDDDISDEEKKEVIQNLSKANYRIGDYYSYDQKFDLAIQHYEKQSYKIDRSIDQSLSMEDEFLSRLLAQKYYILGLTYILQNENDCEIKAIQIIKKGRQILQNNQEQNETDLKQIIYEIDLKIQQIREQYADKFGSEIIELQNSSQNKENDKKVKWSNQCKVQNLNNDLKFKIDN